MASYLNLPTGWSSLSPAAQSPNQDSLWELYSQGLWQPSKVVSTIASFRIASLSWKPSPLLHAPRTSPSPENHSSFYCFHIFAFFRILCSYSHPTCSSFRAAPSLGQKSWPNNFKVRVILVQHFREGMVAVAPWKWEFAYTDTHTHTHTGKGCLLCANNEETESSDGAQSGYSCAGYNLRLWHLGPSVQACGFMGTSHLPIRILLPLEIYT